MQDERSAFQQPQLLSVEKVYVLPRAVSHLHYTTSSKGISNKNLLITLDSGEAYSLDLRLVSPRRPLSEPTAAGKCVVCVLLSAAYQPYKYVSLPCRKRRGSSSLQSLFAPQSCTVPHWSFRHGRYRISARSEHSVGFGIYLHSCSVFSLWKSGHPRSYSCAVWRIRYPSDRFQRQSSCPASLWIGNGRTGFTKPLFEKHIEKAVVVRILLHEH